MSRLLFVAALMIALGAGCYESHGRATVDAGVPATDAAVCPPRPPLRCIAQTGDRCSAWHEVDAECGIDLEWRCPAGARAHEAVSFAETVCLPFRGEIAMLSEAPIPVPTEDECLWVLPTVETPGGETVSYAAVRLDTSAPFGSCPDEPRWLDGEPVGVLDVSAPEPGLLPTITGAYRLGDGTTRVTFRHFVFEDGAPFGVRELGTGIGFYDERRHRIDLPGTVRWAPEVDFGDAVIGDVTHAYVYGCPPPIDFLTEDCVLARLDREERAEVWTGEGFDREASTDEAAPLFDAGPWRSAITHLPDGRWLHLYSVGFGTNLEAHVAPAPEGPWRSLGILAPCDLPEDDEQAFCGGPAIHPELADPFRPNEIVVSFDVATLAPDAAERARRNPDAYYTRLRRLTIPR